MGQLVFQAALGGAVNLIGPNISATTNFTLPGADGTNGQALTTNGSGVLGFSSIVSGAAGSNTQVQFNSGGNFGASASLTWDGTTFSTTGLSASSTVTLSGGTANGVTYLNGSKQLVSGSALTFDGTNFKTTGSVLAGGGVPSSGAGVTLAYNGSTAGYIYSYDWSASAYKLLNIAGGSIDISAANNTQITFGVNGNEQMRLTSTGLGIGTSSPTQKLEVAGSVLLNPTNPALAFNTLAYQVYKQGTSLRLYANSIDHLVCDGSGNVGIGTSSPSQKLTVVGNALVTPTGGWTTGGVATQYFGDIYGSIKYDYNTTNFLISSYGTFSIATNGTSPTTRLTVDSSGNVGIGVTPSAWQSSYKTFQINSQASVSATSSAVYLSNNFYQDSGGTNRYIAAGAAGIAGWEANVFRWYQAASGSAGAVQTTTNSMTLDASGNLMVGATSSSAKLQVSRAGGGVGSSNVVYVDVTSSYGGITVNSASGQNSFIELYQAGTTKRGEFGTDTANSLITVGGFNSYGLALFANGSEKARIDTSGNLCVNTTAKVYEGKVSVSFNGNGGAGSQGIALIDTNASLSGDYVLFVNSSGNVAGRITHNGTTTVAYTTSSDYRLKENIAPMTGALAKVAQLKPVTYSWKEDQSASEGFIAHELAEVCPQAVVGEKDAVDEEGNPKYQGIDTSFLVATLTAAIQELKAEFDAYKASHP